MKIKKVLSTLVIMLCTLSLVVVTPTQIIFAAKSEEQAEYKITQSDINKAVNHLAVALKLAYEDNPDMDEEIMARSVMAYASGDIQLPQTSEDERNMKIEAIYGVSLFSYNRFGKCMLNKMGLGELKNLAKVIFKPKTVKLLKSHAWKKASAKIVNAITKHASKKLASFAVKRIAKFALPGIGWGSLALYGAQCGWNEIK